MRALPQRRDGDDMSDRGSRADRANELDQLADDLEAMYQTTFGADSPFPDSRPGPHLENDDKHATGYEEVARYARERADWLRES